MNLRKSKWKLLARALLVACGISVVGLYHVRTVCAQGCTIQASALKQAHAPDIQVPPCHAQSEAPQEQAHHKKHSGEHEGFCCKIGEMMLSSVESSLEAPRELIVPSFLLPDFLLAAYRLPVLVPAGLAYYSVLIPPHLELSHIPTTVLRI